MRNLKKVLGMVLCLAMMLSIMVVGAGAAFADQDQIDTKHQDAVDMCVALNIINGIEQDGKTIFKPTANVTREQMAKMICILDNGGKEPQLASGSSFSDVAADRWSNPYIEACASRGVVAGVGGGKFNPGGDVTASQAAKMLLVELGYKEDLAKYTGSGWDTRVNIDATKNGYYEDLEDIDVSAPLSREHAAQMIWNALQADEIEYDYTLITDPTTGQLISKEDPKNTGPELLADKYGTMDTDNTTGILTAVKYNTTKETYNYTISKVSEADGSITQIDTYTGVDKDYTNLLGNNVTIVAKAKDNVLGMFAKDSKEVVSGLIGDISNSDKIIPVGTDTKLVVDGTDYKFESTKDFGVFVFMPGYNEFNAAAAYPATASMKFAGPPVDIIPDYWEFTAIDNDDDGDINVIIVYPTFVDEAKYVDEDGVTIAGMLAMMSGETELATEESYQYVNDGAVKSDDITIAPDRTLATFGAIAKLDTVSGTMSGSNKTTATIDGTAYKYNTDDHSTTEMDKSAISEYLNSDVEILVVNGYIANIEGSTSVDINDFILVTGVAGSANTKGYYTAEVLFADGSSQEITLYNKGNSNDTTNAPVEDGTVYTYETSSGRYKLTPAIPTDFDDFDDAAFTKATYQGLADGTNWIPSDSTSDANAKVKFSSGNAKLAADAVIFVKDGDDYSVKTGADLSKVTDADAAVAFAGADKDSKNALTVTFAYIVTEGMSASDIQYAYVTSDVSISKDSDGTYYSFKAWNGTEEVSLTSDGDVNSDFELLDEGAIISYFVDEDGAIIASDTKYPFTVLADSDCYATDGEFGAVIAIDGDSFTWLPESATDLSDATYFEYDKDDSTILFVNSKKDVGVAGAIGDMNIANEGPGDTYFVHAYVLGTGGADAEHATTPDLIVIDTINNNWDLDYYKDNPIP